MTKHSAGRKALDYLNGRGIDQKVIETFALGFSPLSGTGLVKYLIDKKRFLKEEVIEAGLAYQRGSQVADFFRGRLMFPLIDHRDNVVGFSGRIMDNSDTTSKYINTRETLIYHKGDQIYGLNVTKEAIRRENQAIIVEGEFDVLSCFQNGVGQVIAVKGTALTESQVSLLSRFTQKLTFCFDGDKAGQEAIKRSLVVVEKKGLSPTVIEIPGGKDPDEAFKEHSALFKKAVKEDKSVYDYLLGKSLQRENIDTAEGKKCVADLMLPFIAQISNEIIKEHYLKKIAESLDTTYESIARESVRLAKNEKKVVTATQKPVKRSKEETLEEYLLALIVQSEKPKQAIRKAIEIMSESMSRDRAYHKIMDRLLAHFGHTDHFDAKKFADALPQELLQAYDTSLLFPLPMFVDGDKLQGEIENVSEKLKVVYIQEKMKKLATEIKKLSRKGTRARLTN